jgi:hypothetical protein
MGPVRPLEGFGPIALELVVMAAPSRFGATYAEALLAGVFPACRSAVGPSGWPDDRGPG